MILSHSRVTKHVEKMAVFDVVLNKLLATENLKPQTFDEYSSINNSLCEQKVHCIKMKNLWNITLKVYENLVYCNLAADLPIVCVSSTLYPTNNSLITWKL